jgi:hypothetical protein
VLFSKLTKEVRIRFRDELRDARHRAQKDAEGFEAIVFVLERLGTLLSPEARGLGGMRPAIVAVASESFLSSEIPDAWRELHTPFAKLYELVRQARNDAMHEGSAARHATQHAIELSLVLENSLMNGYEKVGDFMVRSPVCAELWQPLSFIRQTMLVNAFSHLPVKVENQGKPVWHLISELTIARHLRLKSNGGSPKSLMAQSLEDALKEHNLDLARARTCGAADTVKDVTAGWDGVPILVTRGNNDDLLGILTPYDLL